jgi:hypothetical protein
MRVRVLTALVAAGATGAVLLAARPTAAPAASSTGVSFKTIGPLAFGPGNVLFAADTDSAAIVALDLGAAHGAPGARPPADFDQQMAALLGTTPAGVAVTDMVVQPGSRNAYFAVMRGTGADAKAALVRLDGAGALTLVSLDKTSYTVAALPNAPVAAPTERRNPRTASITDMVFHDGRLLVAGLSNEEFASKLRAVKYPFAAVDAGTSVEIYHGNHGALETRSPVYTLTPYSIGGTPHLLAGYLCTPLVKFPASVVAAGGKVRGTTIAELGNRNRPIDMFVYTKAGRDYLLMSNTSRGVMKIPTDTFATAAPITERVEAEKAGVAYETIASLTGVEQMDLFDGAQALVLSRAAADGPRTLALVPLP